MKSFSIQSIGINFLFLLFFPVFFGNIGTIGIFWLIITLLAYWSVGRLIIQYTNILKETSILLIDGISVFLGGTLYYLFTSIAIFAGINPKFTLILGLLALAKLLYDVSKEKMKSNFSKELRKNWFVLILITLSLFYGENLVEFINSIPTLRTTGYIDNLFYTSLVASLKGGTISSSFFEIGTPINYHIASFFEPASTSILTGISAHTTLWQSWVPFLRFLSIFIFIEFVAFLLKKYSEIEDTQKIRIVIFLFFAFLGPINPTYLLKFDAGKILWIGIPFTIPDLPALCTGFIASLFIIYLVLSGEFKVSITSKIFFVLMVSFLPVFKVTFFLIAGSILFIYAIWLLKKKESHLFYLSLTALPLAALNYKLFFTPYNVSKTIIKPGFLMEYFSSHSGINGHSAALALIVLVVTVFIIWLNLKLIGLLFQFRFKKKEFNGLEIGCYAALFSLVVAIIFGNTVRIYNYNDLGQMYGDQSFDLLQFIKASLITVSAFAIAGLIIFYSSLKNKLLQKISLIITGIWCLLIAISITVRQSEIARRPIANTDSWSKKIVQEVNQVANNNEGLFGMCSTLNHTGLFISASESGRLWSVFYTGEEGAQRSTKNLYRNRMIKDFLSSNDVEKQAGELKKAGVKYLIAIPENLSIFETFVKNKSLLRVSNCDWVYAIP